MTKKDTKTKDESVNLEKVKSLLDRIENQIDELKDILFTEEYKKSAKKLSSNQEGNIVEGVFDGYQMIDSDGKKYQIPENYASKSKLVEGDVLKLTITSDGGYIFKQIGPIERKKIIGDLGEKDGKYFVKVDDKKYHVLTASVTYFKANVGDKLTIIVPKSKESQWAAVENVIGN